MAEVLFFHHVQGQTPGFLALADALRAAGHTVHTPDLWDGKTFDSIEAGIAFAQSVGFGPLIERGIRTADGLPAGLVYAGYSFGVLPAEALAIRRPGARGFIAFESCAPVGEFGDAWPTGVPVQVHGMTEDAFFAGEGDIDAARALVAEASATASAELFLYEGDGHLFADASAAAHAPDAAALLMVRVLDFLAKIG